MENAPALYATAWAVLPPLIAIGLALITKEVYSSLFLGVLTGAVLYVGADFDGIVNHVLQDGIIASLSDGWNVGILIFLVNIGFGCITTFIALHAQEQGVGGVSSYFLVYAVVTLVTRPYIGKLIDRYGYRIPAILSALCTGATLVIIGASTSADFS